MDFSWPIFAVVLLLGILQVAMGVVIGRALPLGQRRADRTVERRAGHLVQLASRLFRLVGSVAEDVDRHQARIRHASHALSTAHSGEDGRLAEFVLKSMAEVVRVNERLQNRLSAAEEKLKTQTRQIEAHLTEARTDSLTGLPNRRAFDDELARRIAEWERKSATFCLVLIDIDRFKALNDLYGHPAGDEVLRGLAEVLKGILREMDLVARLGGDEFGVLLPSTHSRDAVHATQRLRSAAASARFPVGQQKELSLTVSLGLATVQTGDDPVTVVRRADEALYLSKRTGRNCGHFHDGATCQPIPLGTEIPDPDGNEPAGADHDGPAGSESDPAEIQHACDDLRARLAEIAEEA